MSEVIVIQINFQQTLPLRSKVLKPFLQPEECINPGDSKPETFHLGVFKDNQLVSIGSFELEKSPLLKANLSYRLRGMATDPNFLRQGFGARIINEAESILKLERKADLLWFNARIKAFPFYESLGYLPIGDLFEIERIGPHKVMYKYLI